jgi:hypothetical protein
MRWAVLVFVLLQLLPAEGRAQDRHRAVTIQDPYIELHSGPGRGYPILHVAERGAQIAILKQRTDWFLIQAPRGEEGWVQYDQLLTTLELDGEAFDVPGFSLEDYADRRWEVGVQYGDFGGANVIATYGAFSLTRNLSFEMWLSQALGRFSDSKMASINILHLMYPERRASPFFTLGAGTIQTSPKGTLVATVDRQDSIAHAGIGVRTYLTRRFVFRAEYKTYVVFTSRNDNEDVQEWKAGFSFFF